MSDIAQMMRAANPVPDAAAALPDVELDALLVLTETRSTDMSIDQMEKAVTQERPPYRRPPWLVAAAAFVAVLFIGVAVWAIGFGDEPEVVDPPPTTQATTTTAAPVDTGALAAIGERLMAAFDTYDTDTVDELMADDAAPIDMFGASTKSDVLALIPWMDATGMRLESPRCEGSEPDQVACTPLQIMRWAAAGGARPLEGTMFLKIEDGRVVAMRYGRPAFGFYHDRFRAFIREADPTAPDRMWFTADNGEPYAILSDESYSLFEQYTEEYWEFLRN